MPSNKKKIVFQSDYSLAKTGFGRNAKAILSYLYKTGKYEIVQYCCGINWSNPSLARTPWRSIGCLPDDQREMDELNKDPSLARAASYGSHYLDRIIKQEKPDVYIAAQDIWGVDFSIDRPWFDKINSIIWTTLDSLPILPSATDKADKVKNYWIWSSFATKAMHELGHKHAKTMHGAVEDKCFYRLSNDKRKQLRVDNNIPLDTFIVGFVFRNQLRKSVPNLLEGYKIWKEKNPHAKSALLLHTHFGEGWNIHKLAGEYNIEKSEIYTTYICKSCGGHQVKSFSGQDIDCDICSASGAQVTTQVGLGITEDQLNGVYNLMDVYCHPFTSGGQEIPIQEAKLTELITLVTNYSCGEEMCEPEANSLPLYWSEYREAQTEFRKASTSPQSIAEQLEKVLKMSPEERKAMGEKARQWTIDHYSAESIGKKIEKELDGFDKINFDFSFEIEKKDPNAVIEDTDSDTDWLTQLYAKVLKMKVDENDDGHKYWMQEITKGMPKQDIENYFRGVASKENEKTKETDFSELLDKNDEGGRILYVMPESIGDIFLSTSLFKSINELYPDYNLYVSTKPEYLEILDGNPYVHKVLSYLPQMDDLLWLEGKADHKGYFEIAFLPYVNTQKMLTYLHNRKDKLAYNIKY